jgi:hypothetical protein
MLHTAKERINAMISRRDALMGTVASALMVWFAGQPVHAHDGENGPHGGPMLEVGEFHLELTASGADLRLYLMDGAHAPVASKGASGRVVILEGSQQASLTLAAGEANQLSAKLEKPLVPGARVVVTARLADGRNLTARFVWK